MFVAPTLQFLKQQKEKNNQKQTIEQQQARPTQKNEELSQNYPFKSLIEAQKGDPRNTIRANLEFV